MSPKNRAVSSTSDERLLWAIALVPVFVLCLFVILHPKVRPGRNAVSEKQSGNSSDAILATNLSGWQVSAWEEKERRVDAAVLYFREQMNCAILQSSGHYVPLIDRFLRENPLLREKSLPTVLRGLAIQEYDFYSGVNADDQALKFLGPALFRENQVARKNEEARLRPVAVKESP